MILNNEIHLWIVNTDEITDPDLLNEYRSLLTEEETKRKNRYVFEKSRRQYLIARALLKTLLADYTNQSPHKIYFNVNKYGKPSLRQNNHSNPIQFNLSHTERLIICGFSLTNYIGVDIENFTRKNSTLKIAKRFFSAIEYNDMKTLIQSKMEERFFHYWTLKESYIKAKGKGLSIPLDKFHFKIINDSLHFESDLEDNPKEWNYWLLKPTKNHFGAISVHNKNNNILTLQCKKIIPLKKEKTIDCIVKAATKYSSEYQLTTSSVS
jgi:4'-phosphopantetheinyl transferase